MLKLKFFSNEEISKGDATTYIEEHETELTNEGLFYSLHGVMVKTDPDYIKSDAVGTLKKQIATLRNSLLVHEGDLRGLMTEKAKLIQESKGATLNDVQVKTLAGMDQAIVMKQAEIYRLQDNIGAYISLIADIKTGTYELQG